MRHLKQVKATCVLWSLVRVTSTSKRDWSSYHDFTDRQSAWRWLSQQRGCDPWNWRVIPTILYFRCLTPTDVLVADGWLPCRNLPPWTPYLAKVKGKVELALYEASCKRLCLIPR